MFITGANSITMHKKDVPSECNMLLSTQLRATPASKQSLTTNTLLGGTPINRRSGDVSASAVVIPVLMSVPVGIGTWYCSPVARIRWSYGTTALLFTITCFFFLRLATIRILRQLNYAIWYIFTVAIPKLLIDAIVRINAITQKIQLETKKRKSQMTFDNNNSIFKKTTVCINAITRKCHWWLEWKWRHLVSTFKERTYICCMSISGIASANVGLKIHNITCVNYLHNETQQALHHVALVYISRWNIHLTS